jgi:hypothetical protein
MPDEVFQRMEVTDAERLLIDEVWTDVLHQNRWRRRGWRLLHRLRAFSYLLVPFLYGRENRKEAAHCSPFLLREGGWGVRKMQTRRRWRR